MSSSAIDWGGREDFVDALAGDGGWGLRGALAAEGVKDHKGVQRGYRAVAVDIVGVGGGECGRAGVVVAAGSDWGVWRQRRLRIWRASRGVVSPSVLTSVRAVGVAERVVISWGG